MKRVLSIYQKKGWRFFDGSNWILNEDLSLSIGDPAYPETLSISTLHSGGENNSLVGNYGLLQKKTFKSRPVWKKTNSTGFLFFSGLTWKVGKNIGASDGESVYGWNYSDETRAWPILDTLIIANYPENITLTSRGRFAELQPSYIGVYRRVPTSMRNGRPIWQHTAKEYLEKDLKLQLSYDDNGHWTFLSSKYLEAYHIKNFTTRNVITSAKHGLTDLLNIEWQYHSLKGTHDDDDTLQVLEGTPNYPEILTISNNRTDNHRQVFNELGIYRKLPGVLECQFGTCFK